MTDPRNALVKAREFIAAAEWDRDLSPEGREKAASLVKEIDTALATPTPSPAGVTDEVITRMAKEIEPQLSQAMTFHLALGDPETREALLGVLWDNKVGILRVLQAALSAASNGGVTQYDPATIKAAIKKEFEAPDLDLTEYHGNLLAERVIRALSSAPPLSDPVTRERSADAHLCDVILPPLKPDQVEYLNRIRKSQENIDMSAVVGGPRKSDPVTGTGCDLCDGGHNIFFTDCNGTKLHVQGIQEKEGPIGWASLCTAKDWGR